MNQCAPFRKRVILSTKSNHVVDVSERIVHGHDAAISLLVREGSTSHEATDTAEAVDSDRDRHFVCTIETNQIEIISARK